MDELFSDFDPNPIGVASVRPISPHHRNLELTYLWQLATDRRTGKGVAVKLQHPHLEEFVQIEYAPFLFEYGRWI
jgi:aarF domain-containing kinase